MSTREAAAFFLTTVNSFDAKASTRVTGRAPPVRRFATIFVVQRRGQMKAGAYSEAGGNWRPMPAFLRQPSGRSCTMKKFFALFAIPAGVVENWKKTTNPAKAKAMSDDMMKAWDKWMKDHEKDIVDKGQPLGKTKRVTAQKVSDVRNDLDFYVIVKADSHEAAAELFEDHPHLQIPESSVEIMEIPEMPAQERRDTAQDRQHSHAHN